MGEDVEYEKIWLELLALAWNHPELRERIAAVNAEWRAVLLEAFEEPRRAYGIDMPLDALVEPRTAAELVPVLFRRELDSHQLSFALGEALAHLRLLEDEGRAVRVIDADGVHRFQKA